MKLCPESTTMVHSCGGAGGVASIFTPGIPGKHLIINVISMHQYILVGLCWNSRTNIAII